MPVLPFHRYIGPGNDIDNGPCVDEDDCIARKHDIKYENAKTPQDVRLADVEAIEEFRRNWMSGNWHSLIGDIGLSLKYCVETYTGVIYPKLGDYEPCEIVTLFHDIVKLHCVNKKRLIDQANRVARAERVYDFTKFNKSCESCENFFYVLVMWFQLCKSHEEIYLRSNPIDKRALTHIEMEDVFHDVILKKMRKNPLENSSNVKNCDLFNINAWLRFLSSIQSSHQATPSDYYYYNDEEFSNMFMQYD